MENSNIYDIESCALAVIQHCSALPRYKMQLNFKQVWSRSQLLNKSEEFLERTLLCGEDIWVLNSLPFEFLPLLYISEMRMTLQFTSLRHAVLHWYQRLVHDKCFYHQGFALKGYTAFQFFKWNNFTLRSFIQFWNIMQVRCYLGLAVTHGCIVSFNTCKEKIIPKNNYTMQSIE